MDKQKPKMDRWDDFAGQYLKTDIITSFPVKLVPISVEAEFNDEQKPMLTIDVEYNEKVWKLNLNKTNQNFLRNSGVISPKQIVGKVLTFDKIKQRNPSTNVMVDSFIITDAFNFEKKTK